MERYSHDFMEFLKSRALARFGYGRRDYPLTRFDLPYRIAPIEPDSPSRCGSCGSREFRKHAGARICSYCRSEG